MAKSSKIYWAARQRQLNKALQKAEKDLTKRLSAFYSQESAKLDKEIAAYYAELGEDNVVEYRKMLQHMSDADRKLLMERMDDFAKKYPEKAHLMPTRASIYKLDRLEGLQTSTKLHQMEIGAVTEEEVTKHLKQTAVRSANAAAETLTGKGGSLYELNSPLVEKIVGTNWANGISYSERIWKNTEKLADKLNSDISAGFVRGDSYDKLSKQLMTEMNIRNRSYAERLIYTEGTHVMNEASISVFQEAGFDQYIISPLPDCCEFCQNVADEQNAMIERDRSAVFIQDRQAGMNFPPFHPWCRCSFEIVIPDRDAWIENYVEREARVPVTSQSEKIAPMAGNSLGGIKIPVNEDASFEVNIEGYSEETNKAISRECKAVVYEGEKEGKEILHLLDLDTNSVCYVEIGDEGSVGDKGFYDYLEGNPGRYAFIHNHTDGRGLSYQDANTVMTVSSIELHIGAGNNGVIYCGKYEGSVDNDFYQMYTKCDEEARAAIGPYALGENYGMYASRVEGEAVVRLLEKYGKYYKVVT